VACCGRRRMSRDASAVLSFGSRNLQTVLSSRRTVEESRSLPVSHLQGVECVVTNESQESVVVVQASILREFSGAFD
jgi:hypothetical protein